MAERPANGMARAKERRPGSTRVTGRLVWGIIFLGLGAAWTLDNLGLFDSDTLVRWWPLLLVAFGIAKLTGFGAKRSGLAGTLYLVAGGWLILGTLDIVRTGIAGLIPLALVVIGARILMHAMRTPESREEPVTAATGDLDPRGRVKVDAVMATVERRVREGELQGGEVNSVMGSVELDLREATLAPGKKVVIETNAIMASIVLKVPRGWRVVSEVSCVMASVEDHTDSAGTSTSSDTLILKGATIMAGIEIKH